MPYISTATAPNELANDNSEYNDYEQSSVVMFGDTDMTVGRTKAESR